MRDDHGRGPGGARLQTARACNGRLVSGPRAVLDGVSTGRLFRRGVPPANVPAGTDLSFLLTTTPRFDARQ